MFHPPFDLAWFLEDWNEFLQADGAAGYEEKVFPANFAQSARLKPVKFLTAISPEPDLLRQKRDAAGEDPHILVIR